MDPRIASGFSILGNALMPDPKALAEASVLRSQMLENEASAGKLTAETETIRRTMEQLALLQDILSNPNSTSSDIISRGVASGLTNDPSQIPQLALGAIGTRNLDVNDPGSFSRALLATGTVANQAATPEGFAADQARQAAQAAATDVTARRGQDLVHDASIYDTDASNAAMLEGHRLDNLTEAAIATEDRDLLRLVEAAKNATENLRISKESNDRNIRLGAEERWNQIQSALDAAIARNIEATKLEQTRRDNIAAGQRNADTLANAITRQTMMGESAVAVQEAENAGDLAVQNAKDAAAATAGPTYTNSEGNALVKAIKTRMAQSRNETVDLNDKAAVRPLIQGIDDRDWEDLLNFAFTAHPKNPMGRINEVMGLIKWDEKAGKWKVKRKALNSAYNAFRTSADAEEGEDETDATAAAPVEEALVLPDTSKPALGDAAEGPFWLSADGTHYVYASGKKVK